MKVRYPPIQILIPVFNDKSSISATLDSVCALDYDPRKIYTVFADYGSTDGTVDTILSYPRKNVGFYDLSGRRIGRTIPSDMTRLLNWQTIGRYDFILRPGETLYPHALKVAVDRLHVAALRYQECSMLVAEADIRREDGTVRKQSPLFTRRCTLRARTLDALEYLRTGYRHQVFTFGPSYYPVKDKIRTQLNQRTWWNSLAPLGMGLNVFYTNEPLVCLMEPNYDDELDELLLRLEMCYSYVRGATTTPEAYVINEEFEPSYRRQLARYALWRSWLLYGQKKIRQAEDCHLFSQVIYLPIEQTECFARTEQLIMEGNPNAGKWLDEYYAKEDEPLRPKWPFGGPLQHRWNGIRKLFIKDKRSVWDS